MSPRSAGELEALEKAAKVCDAISEKYDAAARELFCKSGEGAKVAARDAADECAAGIRALARPEAEER